MGHYLANSESFGSFLIVTFMFLGVFGYVYYKKLRSKEFKSVADKLGFKYTKKSNLRDDVEANSIVGLMGLFMTIYNSISGDRGVVKVNIFEKLEGTGRGDAYQSTLMLKSPELNLPLFSMSPRSLSFGSQDSTYLTEFTDFEDLYDFEGIENSIRNMITKDIASYFFKNRRISVEGYKNTIVIYRYMEKIEPPSVEKRINEGLEIYELFK